MCHPQVCTLHRRIVSHRLRFTIRDFSPLIQYNNAVRNAEHDFQIVFHQQHRDGCVLQ
ncbi:hypothetical protein D3C87_2201950 [compost metagenome]